MDSQMWKEVMDSAWRLGVDGGRNFGVGRLQQRKGVSRACKLANSGSFHWFKLYNTSLRWAEQDTLHHGAHIAAIGVREVHG